MQRTQLALIGLAVVVQALSACGPSAEEIAKMTAAAATDTPVPTQTPSPTETPEEIEPVGTDLNTPLPAGEAARGGQLFDDTGCDDCHSLAEGVRISQIGPSVYGIADRAGTTIKGYSAETYLRESIVLPCEFLTDEGPFCPMPRNYGERLDA